ncbi:muramoyltetrapeptide carboxypeptidase [Caulobacter ginsengisoli]|uniref:Muramoyltetrapeptide carboxypeptidase n=1 Tax=Caulobacter ginsengisoli TaxID=400775 RepID=A0ABU0IKZ1_9CAUL|nr:LD-carboxypeptidase [Caulobacter ginsengisoli]MDQ0462681.1 muramoyltetrapeptide carboxypeptidase [Caulobacter ginsengisoli]
MKRIGIVAPASRLIEAFPDRLRAAMEPRFGGRVELIFHPQCFEDWGHFAGTDDSRARAFVDIANDPSLDALWFGRGGYGSCRIVEAVMPKLNEAARAKAYLGYSDAGSMLGALYKASFPHVAHGPVAADLHRQGGQAAVERALAWLVDRDPASLEPGLGALPHAAFNLTILSHLIGTPWMPDLTGHVLLIEEVSEHMYRIDRALWHVVHAVKGLAGLRLGRCSDIPDNDPDFAQTEEEVAQHWCAVSGVPYLGRADIGHDADNKVVPFGVR